MKLLKIFATCLAILPLIVNAQKLEFNNHDAIEYPDSWSMMMDGTKPDATPMNENGPATLIAVNSETVIMIQQVLRLDLDYVEKNMLEAYSQNSIAVEAGQAKFLVKPYKTTLYNHEALNTQVQMRQSSTYYTYMDMYYIRGKNSSYMIGVMKNNSDKNFKFNKVSEELKQISLIEE